MSFLLFAFVCELPLLVLKFERERERERERREREREGRARVCEEGREGGFGNLFFFSHARFFGFGTRTTKGKK